MPSTLQLPAAARDDMTARLKRIEGQARGIQKMIEDDRDCVSVMNQMASIKAAVNSLSGEMLESFALYCIRHPDQFASPEQAVEKAVQALVRSGR
jgi:CsoR family transcriptional regulator, copper-sensing transcriptional repressor